MKRKNVFLLNILTLCCSLGVNGYNTYLFDNVKTSFHDPHIVTLGARVKRDAPTQPPTPPPSPHLDLPATANASDSNNTTNIAVSTTIHTTTLSTTTPLAVVTQTPLLGQNGSGILHVNMTNSPRVSEPILADDNITDEYMKIDTQKMKAEHNLTNVVEDNHSFYNSSFIGNLTYFNEYWTNITKQNPSIHSVLSNSHRRATTLRLSFDFPFYGHPLRNITVATGGFIYTGEHVHNWLAATQYIAPLMANFDTTLTNDSYVKMYDDGEKFTAFWENVTLQEEDITKKFTFAVTLYKNGDIVFAYKDIPQPVQNISDSEHPVKVGISDAYLTDRILFLVRRKTIYEYHRVSFKNYEIKNNTILRLTALPTCLQYDSCDTCVNHDTGFDCMWCDAIRKCSSGTDRNKQDWVLRNCERNQISNASMCGAPKHAADTGSSTAYSTDSQTPVHDADVHNIPSPSPAQAPPALGPQTSPVRSEAAPAQHSSIGGAVAAFTALALVAAAGVWVLYAFKNPHTRSGQLLIKYRPSQWSWRRGEARYTAATIHM